MALNSSDDGRLTLRSSGGDSFSQTGQVDWIAFLRGTAEATVSILTRLSSSGVEPLTILVAQRAFTTMHISKSWRS